MWTLNGKKKIIGDFSLVTYILALQHIPTGHANIALYANNFSFSLIGCFCTNDLNAFLPNTEGHIHLHTSQSIQEVSTYTFPATLCLTGCLYGSCAII